MALHPEQRERLEREHGFAEWRGSTGDTAAGAAADRGFEFKGDELPGWALVQSRRNEALDPPRLETFWRPAGGGIDALLGIRVIERASVPAAREALLALLADIESAVIRRRTDLDIGDVVFGQEMTLAFARGNLVIVVRNAGPRVVPVLPVARAVDALVMKAGEQR
jgi:hypothetical protein